jgi:CRISPR-associated protein Cmr6
MTELKAALLGPRDLPDREFTLGSARVERRVNRQGRVSFKVEPSYAFGEPSCVQNRQANLSLLFQRYAPRLVEELLIQGGVAYGQQERGQLIKVVGDFSKQFRNTAALEWTLRYANGCGASSALKQARDRWSNAITQTSPSVALIPVKLCKRAAIGLANASPWENSGWAFHHTYGVPMIPGDSLKGVMRHFLEEELASQKGGDLLKALGFSGESAARYLAALAPFVSEPLSAQDLANLLFGQPGSDGAEGLLAVYDAWPESPDGEGWFALDVVTSHHKTYYTSGYEEDSSASDQDQPNPVHFLTLRPGLIFHIALAPTAVAQRQAASLRENAEGAGGTAKGATEEQRAFIQAIVEVGKALCLRALAEWGVGAKTGTGYGRLKGQKKGAKSGDGGTP